MAWGWFSRWRRRRRQRALLASPMDSAWEPWLDAAPQAERLRGALRDRWRDKTRILVDQFHWEGCGGFELTDEHRVAIAGQAALLILERKEDLARIPAVLVYPEPFVNPLPRTDATGVVTSGLSAHGEAWQRGPVILDWKAVERGIRRGNDGRNVVIHEFAHKLDMLDGYANGAPPLRTGRLTRRWQATLGAAYEQLCRANAQGRATLLDTYGTVNPAEFFAVATECFFEQGRKLRRRHPELYEVLADYFGQDPAA